jgi:hypothetical protein
MRSRKEVACSRLRLFSTGGAACDIKPINSNKEKNMGIENKLFSELTDSEISDLSKAKSETTARFLSGGIRVQGATRSLRAQPAAKFTQNVVGVGIDEKYVENVPTGISCIKFLVRSKMPLSALSRRDKLPESIDGIPTDVEEVGLIVPFKKKTKAGASAAATLNPRSKIRPAQPGSSVGFKEPTNAFVMAGTFGAVVKDSAGNRYILSNNHVIAFENGIEADGVTRRQALSPGAPIFQPGLLDGGSISTDKIAELTRWIDLRADQPDNKVDAAIAKVLNAGLVSPSVLFIGGVTGKKVAVRDMIVHKFGRTTSYRVGQVTSVVFDLTIPYEVGDVLFADQIAIRGLNGQRFSDSGDSGSLILERGINKAVGLLFAGATNGSLTFANHISDVLTQLNVELV